MSGKQDLELLTINRMRALLKQLPSFAARLSVLEYVSRRAMQEAQAAEAAMTGESPVTPRVFAPEGTPEKRRVSA